MAENRLGYENATRIRQGLKPRRNVNTAAIEVAAFDQDIAEIDPDAQ
jgi:hypothetical protein